MRRIVANGAKVTIGARKRNGMDKTTQDYTSSAEGSVRFTTGPGVHEIEIYAQVIRYQTGDPATVDNISVR